MKKTSKYHWISVSSRANKLNGYGFIKMVKELLPFQEKQTRKKNFHHLKRLYNLKVSWDQYIILQGTSHIWQKSRQHSVPFLRLQTNTKPLICRRSRIPHFIKVKISHRNYTKQTFWPKSRHTSSLRCIYKQTRRGPKTKHKRGVGSYCVRIKIPKFVRRKIFSE